MTELTVLDLAHQAMQDAQNDDAARLAFYERLAASELFLMLAEDVDDASEQVTPEVFDLGEAKYVLVFDREERLASFAERVTPYVALSGRAIVEMISGQGIGLGVNLDVAPSAALLPPEVITWLSATLGHQPDEVEDKIAEISKPVGVPEKLLGAIDTKLATAMGLATFAYLVGVRFSDGRASHLLGFVDALPHAQSALTQAVSEALTFSGIEAGAIDIAFVREHDPITEKLERFGLRFDLPQMQQSVERQPAAPGSDPAKPPILK